MNLSQMKQCLIEANRRDLLNPNPFEQNSSGFESLTEEKAKELLSKIPADKLSEIMKDHGLDPDSPDLSRTAEQKEQDLSQEQSRVTSDRAETVAEEPKGPQASAEQIALLKKALGSAMIDLDKDPESISAAEAEVKLKEIPAVELEKMKKDLIPTEEKGIDSMRILSEHDPGLYVGLSSPTATPEVPGVEKDSANPVVDPEGPATDRQRIMLHEAQRRGLLKPNPFEGNHSLWKNLTAGQADKILGSLTTHDLGALEEFADHLPKNGERQPGKERPKMTDLLASMGRPTAEVMDSVGRSIDAGF